jgi:hypothetical protein
VWACCVLVIGLAVLLRRAPNAACSESV